MEVISAYCRIVLGIGAHIWLILDIFQYFKEKSEHKKRKEYITVSFCNLPTFKNIFLMQEDYMYYRYNRMLFIENMLAGALIYLYLYNSSFS